MRATTSFEGCMVHAVLCGFVAVSAARMNSLWIFAVLAAVAGGLALIGLLGSVIEMHAERYDYRLAKERRARTVARLHVLKQRRRWLEEEIAQRVDGMGG